jgi:hypothetical protein
VIAHHAKEVALSRNISEQAAQLGHQLSGNLQQACEADT